MPTGIRLWSLVGWFTLAVAASAGTAASYLTADGAVSVVGYNDMADLFRVWGEAYQTAHPAVRFAFDLKSTRSAPAALAKGASLFAPMGASMSEDQLAEVVAADGLPPVAFRVAHDSVTARSKSSPIAIVVRADNPLTKLTVAEVARIFTGPMGQTWGDYRERSVWAGRTIHPYALGPETPLEDFMVREKFGGAPVPKFVPVFHQSRDVVHAVEADRDGIGFAAINAISPKVRVLAISAGGGAPYLACDATTVETGLYPFDRFLLIYLHGKGADPLAVSFLRYILSDEGQATVARSPQDYLPLNPAEREAERAKLDLLAAGN